MMRCCVDMVVLVLPSPPLYHSVILLRRQSSLLPRDSSCSQERCEDVSCCPRVLLRLWQGGEGILSRLGRCNTSPAIKINGPRTPQDGARLTPPARKWGDVNAQAGIHTWGRRIGPDRKTRYSSKSSPITNTKCIITDLDPLVLIVFPSRTASFLMPFKINNPIKAKLRMFIMWANTDRSLLDALTLIGVSFEILQACSNSFIWKYIFSMLFISERRISSTAKVGCRKVIWSFLNASTHLHCPISKLRESKKFTCNSKQNWVLKDFTGKKKKKKWTFCIIAWSCWFSHKGSFWVCNFFISKKLNNQNYSNSKVQKGKQFIQWVTTPCTTQQPITAKVGPPVCFFGLTLKSQIREQWGPTKVQINFI